MADDFQEKRRRIIDHICKKKIMRKYFLMFILGYRSSTSNRYCICVLFNRVGRSGITRNRDRTVVRGQKTKKKTSLQYPKHEEYFFLKNIIYSVRIVTRAL